MVRKLSNFRSLIFFLFKKHLFQVNIQSIQISNSLSKFFFLLRGTFSFLHSQDLGKGFLVSSQLLGTQTWVGLASHLGLCGHTLFRLFQVVGYRDCLHVQDSRSLLVCAPDLIVPCSSAASGSTGGSQELFCKLLESLGLP